MAEERELHRQAELEASQAKAEAFAAKKKALDLTKASVAQARANEAIAAEKSEAEHRLSASSCALALAAETVCSLQEQVARLQPPQFSQVGLGESDRSRRRYTQIDVEYLERVLTERSWRPLDVTKALEKAGMLKEIFDSPQLWKMRLTWLGKEMDKLKETQWSVESTMGLMIDAVMSYGDLQKKSKDFFPREGMVGDRGSRGSGRHRPNPARARCGCRSIGSAVAH